MPLLLPLEVTQLPSETQESQTFRGNGEGEGEEKKTKMELQVLHCPQCELGDRLDYIASLLL